MSARTTINLPGFTFQGHGEQIYSPMFGHGVAFDVYAHNGGRTPELAEALKAQQAKPFEEWTIMTSAQRYGITTIYVRV